MFEYDGVEYDAAEYDGVEYEPLYELRPPSEEVRQREAVAQWRWRYLGGAEG